MTTGIRNYASHDEDAVVALSLRAWTPVFASLEQALGHELFARLHPDWREDQEAAVRAALADTAMRVWVATAGSQPIGFAAATLHQDRLIGEIYMLAVDPGHQHQGAGAALTQAATDWLRSSGMRVAMVETGGDPGHAPARRVYERAGYTALPVARYFLGLSDHDDSPLPGVSALDDLRLTLSLDEITGYLEKFGTATEYDSATRLLLERTKGHLDLHLEEHRLALITWLRAWGARHLRRADTQRTAETLRTWWETWGARLPGEQATLNALTQAELTDVGQAYDALRSAPAAARSAQGRDIAVTFGDTATAKALFAIRPQALLPWDEQIRVSFGRPVGGPTYVKMLKLAAAALDGLASRLGADVGDLPGLLGRPGSSLPRLVDQYLWVRMNRR